MVNIIVAGVGGQGLVLATRIIGEVGLRSGFEVKTNDVVGLSQRGGMVSGTVRIGEKVDSPNIKEKTGDVILAMEPLEGYRWSHLLKDGGTIIINTKEVLPTPVLLEKAQYPEEEIKKLKEKFNVVLIDGPMEARAAGNEKATNTVLMGALAKILDFKLDIWEDVLRENVPKKAIKENIKAFKRGYSLY